MPPGPRFYLGVHRPHWLALSDTPLFVSFATLGKVRRLPRARAPWALDSRGFSELSAHGRWTVSAREYVAAVRRFRSEIGGLQFASIQDWMCEPDILTRTGLTVAEHQRRTVASFLELRELAPELPWLPVLQGWCRGEHARHVEMYAAAGVDLELAPLVGVGTICRRSSVLSISAIVAELAAPGLRLHAFGAKAQALPCIAQNLVSADSTAWSLRARWAHREARAAGLTTAKTGEQNDFAAAQRWYTQTIRPALDAQPFTEAAHKTLQRILALS